MKSILVGIILILATSVAFCTEQNRDSRQPVDRE